MQQIVAVYVGYMSPLRFSCQYVGCLSLWRRVYTRKVSFRNCVYIRPDEALTLETLALENLCGHGPIYFNLSLKKNQIVRSLVVPWTDCEIGRKVWSWNPHRGSRMFVTNAWHLSLKIWFLDDRFTVILMQNIWLFSRAFSEILFSYRYKMHIKGAWKGC